LDVLEELGEVPEALRLQILENRDVELIGKWIKQALRVDSIQAFKESIEKELV